MTAGNLPGGGRARRLNTGQRRPSPIRRLDHSDEPRPGDAVISDLPAAGAATRREQGEVPDDHTSFRGNIALTSSPSMKFRRENTTIPFQHVNINSVALTSETRGR